MRQDNFSALYHPTRQAANAVCRAVVAEFPEARVVGYRRGWAVQTRKSGDYLAPNGRPTMENRMNVFFS